jgi:hypothetical protein
MFADDSWRGKRGKLNTTRNQFMAVARFGFGCPSTPAATGTLLNESSRLKWKLCSLSSKLMWCKVWCRANQKVSTVFASGGTIRWINGKIRCTQCGPDACRAQHVVISHNLYYVKQTTRPSRMLWSLVRRHEIGVRSDTNMGSSRNRQKRYKFVSRAEHRTSMDR